MSALKSSNHAERSAALEARIAEIKTEHDRRKAELERVIKTVASNFEACKADAQAEVEATRQALGRKLAADWHEAAKGHILAWVAQPSRRSAQGIGALFSAFDDRATRELGDNFWDMQIAMAFMDSVIEANPGAVSIFGADGWGMSKLGGNRAVECAASVRKAISAGPQAMHDALLALELAVNSAASARTDSEVSERNARIYAARRECATRRDGIEAERRENALFEQEQADLRKAAPGPHAGASSRGLRWGSRLLGGH